MREILPGIMLLHATYTDIKEREISGMLIVIFTILGIICGLFGTEIGGIDILFGIVIGVICVGISIITNGEFGMGDALIICVLGLFLGFIKNIEIILSALFLSTIFSIIIYCFKRNFKYEFPFIPFLFVSYLLNTISRIGGIYNG